MTVEQLIEELEKCNPDAKVIFESGKYELYVVDIKERYGLKEVELIGD